MSDARAAGGAFRIGTVFGIPIRIHFTFLLLLVWWGAGSAQAGRGFLDGVVFILLVFACVVLHELGHAAAGHRFGVQTREIVLYPIGGVARLDRIPAGMAEFWIALAGPAVNFVLGSTVLLFLLLSGEVPTFDGQGMEFAGAPLLGQTQGGVDPLDELLDVERLLEEVESAQAHGAHRRRHVGVAGEKDHRHIGALLPQPVMDFRASNARHPDVEQHAAGAAGLPATHEILAGGIFLGDQADAGEDFDQEAANLYVIIDDADGVCGGGGHGLRAGLARRYPTVGEGYSIRNR